MVARANLDVPVKLAEEFDTVRGEKGENRQGPLLQLVVGKQSAGDFAFMRVQHAGSESLGTGGFAAHAFELIEHLLRGSVERAHEGLVQLGKGRAQAFEQALQLLFSLLKTLGKLARQYFGFHLWAKFLPPGEYVAHIHVIFFYQVCDVWRHHSKSISRQNPPAA